jgi:hypothetical protein
VVRFTLTTPGTGTAATPPPTTGPGGTVADPGQTGSESTPVWPWLVGAGALLLAGVVVALRVSRAG